MNRLIRMSSHLIGYSVGLTARTLVQILGGSRRRTTILMGSWNQSGPHRSPSVTTKPSTSSPNMPTLDLGIYSLDDPDDERLSSFRFNTISVQTPLLHWPEEQE